MPEPKIAARSPYKAELAAGTYAWCSCGHSATQPFCDGSHKGTGFSPKMFEMKEKAFVALCMCKHSANGERCDGSHKSLPPA